MPSEHREALQQARMESAQALILHRRARSQYRQDLESGKVVWLQAKKDGARLLQVVDRYFRKAA